MNNIRPDFRQGFLPAVNSRKLFSSYLIPENGDLPPIPWLVATDIFNIDPSSPFFYIFAAGCAGNGVALPTATLFQFMNGGSVVNQETLYWGTAAQLDEPTILPSQACINLMIESPAVQMHDTISQTCAYPNSGNGEQGMITRWSALADSVSVSSTILYNTSEGGYTLIHGVLQQPWT